MEADYESPADEIDEIRERLVSKLKRMKKRDDEQGAERQTSYGVARHEQRMLVNATEEQQRRVIEAMTVEQTAGKFDAEFEKWAHENQLPPNGEGWRVWLMMAGRGFGKTRAGAEWVYRLAERQAGRADRAGRRDDRRRANASWSRASAGCWRRQVHRRQAQLGAEPGPAEMARTGARRNCFRATMPTACAGRSMILPGATSSPNGGRRRRRGMNLQFGLRRGPRPRALVTTTPRPMELLKRIDRSPWTMTTAGTDERQCQPRREGRRGADRDLWRDADRRRRSWTASCSRMSRGRCGRGR